MIRSPHLGVERLESRCVPAGLVKAQVVSGVAVIQGDDNHNAFDLQMTGSDLTLLPQDGTLFNDLPAGSQLTLNNVTGIAADLGDGNDTVTLVNTSDLVLPAGAKFALGSEDNALYLITSGKIDLGKLTVTGGDGFDDVNVTGGAGTSSRITGPASVSPGNGGANIGLENLDLPGTAGLTVTGGVGDDVVKLTNVTVARGVTTRLGAGAANDLNVSGGRAGKVSLTGLGGSLELNNTAVSGNASVKLAAYPSVTVSGTTITGGLSIQSTQSVVGDVLAIFTGTGSVGGLKVDSAASANVNVNPGSSYTVVKDVTVTARTESATLRADGGTLAARHVKVTGREQTATALATNGGTLALSGNLTVTSPGDATVQGDTGGTMTVDGDVAVTSKAGSARWLEFGSTFAARNVTVTSTEGAAVLTQNGASTVAPTGNVTMKGRSRVALAQSGGSLSVGGDLKMTTRDQAVFQQTGAASTVSVGGNLSFRSDLGTASFSATGKSVSVTRLMTLDGGFVTTSTISTDEFSEVGGLRVMSGTRAVAAGPVAFVSAAAKAYYDKLKQKKDRDDKATSIGIHVSLGVIEAEPIRFAPALGSISGLPADIQLGSPGRPVTTEGDLIIQTGGTADSVTLREVTVGGRTSIQTGGGRDTLTIDDGSTFTGTFAADLGTGDDWIVIAQDTAQAAPVTFTGRASIKAGDGSDTLNLGLAGGDGNSKVVFVAAGSVIDAGSGQDQFDDETGQFTGIALGVGISGWDDPTP